MDVEECQRIVRDFERATPGGLPPNLIVQCLKWDGDPKTRTARGFFTADPLLSAQKDLQAGGTSSSSGSGAVSGTIVLIPERVYGGEKEVKELLSHELVHAYDHCHLRRDLTTCEELACSEVRAAREAECAGYDTALLRGVFCRTFGGSFKPEFCSKVKQDCVRRIAERSTRSVFSEQQARECVEKVFERCFADLRGPGRDEKGTSTSAEPPRREIMTTSATSSSMS